MTPAYYNEIDPFAAAWLRSLIAAGHIAPGDVDERSITDVSPNDLVGYGQCHFFAGIGGWSLALRLAGVPDDEPIWTGSCPCQGLSVAGKRGMRTDDWTRLRAGSPDPVVDARHLWPAFQRLIRERAPAIVVGEQTASADGRTWLTAVRADLEALGYGVGAADLCAAGVGAPHIRQRLWWGGVRVDDPHRSRRQAQRDGEERTGSRDEVGLRGAVSGLADAHLQPRDEGRTVGGGRDQGGDAEPRAGLGCGGVAGGLADANGSGGPQLPNGQRERHESGPADGGATGRVGDAVRTRRQGPVNIPNSLQAEEPKPGFKPVSSGPRSRPPHVDWRDADWLGCRDGRWRPVEPSSRPLVDGVPARVGRLRGYGNAIVPEVAAAFVSAFLECAA